MVIPTGVSRALTRLQGESSPRDVVFSDSLSPICNGRFIPCRPEKLEMNKNRWIIFVAAPTILVLIFLELTQIRSPLETYVPSQASNTINLLTTDKQSLPLPTSFTNHSSQSSRKLPPSPDTHMCSSFTYNGTAQRLMYNRVPKCGSTSVHALIKAMARINHFKYKLDPHFYAWHVKKAKQIALVNQFCRISSPMVFNRHIHYVDFTKFGLPSPGNINVVRDPIEHLRSYYYYLLHRRDRKLHPNLPYNLYNAVEIQILLANRTDKNQTFDDCIMKKKPLCRRVTDLFTIIPFFCGQDEMCWTPSPSSLAKAKYNVKNNYQLVGLTEDIETLVEGLENLLPHFFKGASAWFNRTRPLKNVNKKKSPLKKTTEDYLRTQLHEEYDFYQFTKQLFYEKLAAWRKESTSVI